MKFLSTLKRLQRESLFDLAPHAQLHEGRLGSRGVQPRAEVDERFHQRLVVEDGHFKEPHLLLDGPGRGLRVVDLPLFDQVELVAQNDDDGFLLLLVPVNVFLQRIHDQKRLLTVDGVEEDVRVDHAEVLPGNLFGLGRYASQIVEADRFFDAPVGVDVGFVGVFYCRVEDLPG